MDARTNDADVLKADFYLCLARAFMVPQQADFFAALRDDLADELEALAGEIGYPLEDQIAEYRRRIATVPDAGELLRIYSRLFLQPPRAVHINTGVYLDGSFNGGSVSAIRDFYAAAGIARSAEFLDLDDHAAVQLECVAYLYSHALAGAPGDGAALGRDAAGRFLGSFVSRWTGPLCSDLVQAERELDMPDEPYLPLARVLEVAAATDASRHSDLAPAQQRRVDALASARHKQAEKGVTEADLAEIRRRLEERGLATDHLDIAPGLRDEAQGWQRMVPPTPRGK